jgi:hypothetical protein
VSFEVMSEPSTLMLNKGEKDLLAGLEQEMVLTVCAGSYAIAKVKIVLKFCVTINTTIIYSVFEYYYCCISGCRSTGHCIGVT